ncbi:MAG: hypothetical protein KBG47_08935 [Bacteroidia bacterium]|nr:hypothetical protein [Sphingobacteriaceae bacterium]MBP9069619.1 hypothetical protein [Bacteroidia bacterium]
MKKLAICAMILFGSLAVNANSGNDVIIVKEIPAKTICIKNGMANDVNTFFSNATSLFFEVYKPGTKADLVAMIDKLKAVDGVENASAGTINGDYYAITLTLKTKKDKAWFAKAFAAAGLEYIKINNNEIVEVAKL